MKFLSLAVSFALATSASAFVPTFVGRQSNHPMTVVLDMARKPFISGNWKLNPQTKEEASQLAFDIARAVSSSTPDADFALFVPYVFIPAAMEATRGSKVMIGAEVRSKQKQGVRLLLLCFIFSQTIQTQAAYSELKGAFTGAVSPPQLQSIGVQWALAGHSERRVIFKETDDEINAQCKALIAQGMSVMLCIGESEAEYEKNLAGAVCEVQLKKGLRDITKQEMSRVAIAYEPVWA